MIIVTIVFADRGGASEVYHAHDVATEGAWLVMYQARHITNHPAVSDTIMLPAARIESAWYKARVLYAPCRHRPNAALDYYDPCTQCPAGGEET